MSVRSLIRALLTATASIAALALAARAWLGPYRFGLSVGSPVNTESIFAAALLLSVFIARRVDPRPPPTPVPLPGFRNNAIAIALLLLALTIGFWPTFSVGFLADDYAHIAAVSKADLSTLARWFTAPASDNLFFRPIAMLSYRMDFTWAGFSSIRWHAAGLALHAINAILVFAFGRRLTLGVPAALFAAGVFALHGSRPEAVTWVAARFDLLSTLFVLIALLLFLFYRLRPRAHLLALMLAATLCGLFSKESAFVLPLLTAALAWFHGDWGPAVRRAIAAMATVTIAAFAYRWFILGGIGGYTHQAGITASFNLALALKAVLLRLGAVLMFPINWTDPLSFSLRLLLTFALVALLVIGLRARWDRLVLLGLCFALIAALPVYHLLLIGPDLEKSRVIYLGSAGFALFLAAVVRNAERRLAIPAALIILCFHTAAIRHNLATYERVARIHLTACNFLGSEALRLHSEVVAIGMPNIWDGVYMLKTGLPECLEIRHGIAASSVHMVTGAQGAGRYAHLPAYAWDDATATVISAPLPH